MHKGRLSFYFSNVSLLYMTNRVLCKGSYFWLDSPYSIISSIHVGDYVRPQCASSMLVLILSAVLNVCPHYKCSHKCASSLLVQSSLMCVLIISEVINVRPHY